MVKRRRNSPLPPEVAHRMEEFEHREIVNPHQVEMAEREFDRINAVQGELINNIQFRRGIPRGHK